MLRDQKFDLEGFCTFNRSCSNDGRAWFILVCEEHLNFDGVVFPFSLFNFGSNIWDFLELSIFKIGGQIRNLCDFPFAVLISVRVLGFSMDILVE